MYPSWRAALDRLTPARRTPTRPALLAALTALVTVPALAVAAVLLLPLGRAAERVPPPSVAATLVADTPRAGQSGTAHCTDPVAGRQWGVRWQLSADPQNRLLMQPLAFLVRAAPTRAIDGARENTATVDPLSDTQPGPDGWRSADTLSWTARWTPEPAEAPDAPRRTQYRRIGPLSELTSSPVPVAQLPRYVSPDGACSVFPLPFARTDATGPTLAVLGDSLVTQLTRTSDDPATADALTPRLAAGGWRPTVLGEGGRRWTVSSTSATAAEQSDDDLLDEIRGLIDSDALVIALGVNDAGWVAQAPDESLFELRMAWVLMHLSPVLDEVRANARCAVLVTAADRNQTYRGVPAERYGRAATELNDYLRAKAATDPSGRLRIWEWADASAIHHRSDPQPWFAPDTIHLNEDGRDAYADQLVEAAGLCR